MRLLSILAALALSTSAAFAEPTAGSLLPGAPAGVKRAQASNDNTLLFVALGAAAVAFAGYAISQGGHTTLAPAISPATAS